MRRLYMAALTLLAAALLCTACHRQEKDVASGKLRIVTTLFPLYDFAKHIGGDKVEVRLLLPPGTEPHSFEPKPDDIVRVNRADLFIYTNRYMEPWAAQIVSGLDKGKPLVIDASRGVALLKATGFEPHSHEGEGHAHGEGGMDPHIWLDFDNARIMVDNILAGLVAGDPTNRAYYEANAAAYKAQLADLDQRYRSGLSLCAKRVFLHGGHFAFGYLALRYGLRYQSAYAVNADAEPTPARLADLIKQMRANGLQIVYTEELLNPRVAETIARETGATLLMLHGAHNISKEDFDRGVTFTALMEQNLKNLRTGLQCR
jgi:zinc transport system substrate-binding protein